MKTFKEQQDDLVKEVVKNLCQIKDTSQLLPHVVYIEEENETGEPEYNKYTLLEIRNDGGCSVLDCNGIRIDQMYSLSDINVDWLITIWDRHIDLLTENNSSEKRNMSMKELTEAVDQLGANGGGSMEITGTWRGKQRSIWVEQTHWHQTPVCLVGGNGHEVSAIHPRDVTGFLYCVIGNYLDGDTFSHETMKE